MKITIIGTGFVGGSLGTARLAAEGNIQAQNIDAAVEFADVIAIAVPRNVLENILTSIPDWSGKILIDANNGAGSGQSLAQDVADWATGARVVKAFNTIGANRYAHPDFNGQTESSRSAIDRRIGFCSNSWRCCGLRGRAGWGGILRLSCCAGVNVAVIFRSGRACDRMDGSI